MNAPQTLEYWRIMYDQAEGIVAPLRIENLQLRAALEECVEALNDAVESGFCCSRMEQTGDHCASCVVARAIAKAREVLK